MSNYTIKNYKIILKIFAKSVYIFILRGIIIVPNKINVIKQERIADDLSYLWTMTIPSNKKVKAYLILLILLAFY